ncbi:MAG TPA: hypothetical protein VN695_11140 [Streptosporangiaceae bacterium]|nr:hypothetical protein [Streptosporangiaceae bacterium]
MFPRGTSLAVGALLMAGVAGCGVVAKINNVRHAVDTNRSAIKLFTQDLRSGEATSFSATYVTTGGSPTTTTYAVKPPTDVAFVEVAQGSGTADFDLISNGSGEYSCTSAGASSGWSCQKLGKAEAIAQNQIVGFYTPSHWVAFLNAFSIAAGFAGDKVTTSSMTVNGFSMHCVDFNAKGVHGTSTICSTAQNILGYVKVAGDATSFELKSYSSSPAASLFQLPAGAKLTPAS